MNAAKVMPVDLAMHMAVNRHPQVRQLSEMPALRSQHPFTRSSPHDSFQLRGVRSPPFPSPLVSPLSSTSPCGKLKKKKRVVFADAKGLALTMVRIFNSDPPLSDEKDLSSPLKMKFESSMESNKPHVRLGFPRPSPDLPSILESLAESLVRLESCSLICGSLFGKVRVYNISAEKAVHVRITHDSWRSHQDIPCIPIRENYGSSETELFVFNVPIRSRPNVQDRVEFCISFRPGSGNMLLWDRNGGRNYRILVEDMNSKDVVSVQKKPLRPQNCQNPKLLPQRSSAVLYRSKSCNSFSTFDNTSTSLSKKNSQILKTTRPANYIRVNQ